MRINIVRDVDKIPVSLMIGYSTTAGHVPSMEKLR
jgi:hypothetical protein